MLRRFSVNNLGTDASRMRLRYEVPPTTRGEQRYRSAFTPCRTLGARSGAEVGSLMQQINEPSTNELSGNATTQLAC